MDKARKRDSSPNNAIPNFEKLIYVFTAAIIFFRSLYLIGAPVTNDIIDTPLIYRGLSYKHTFWSTFAWWHETWAGIVPFWRPLTSQIFWIENTGHLRSWGVVAFASHLLFITLISILTYKLTGRRWAGAIAALLFSFSQTGTFFDPIASSEPAILEDAVSYWKNQPDLWCAVTTLAAMVFALNGRYFWGVAAAFISVAFKESGWLAYPLCLSVILYSGRLRMVPVRTYVAVALGIGVLLVLRHLAGPEVWRGYHQGSNTNWTTKYIASTTGVFFSTLTSPNWPSAILAIGITCSLFWPQLNFWLRLAAFLAANVVGAILVGVSFHCSFAVGLTQLLSPDMQLLNVTLCTIWLTLALIVLSNKGLRPLSLYLVFCMAVTALPYVSAFQVKSHALYLQQGFVSILEAVTILAFAYRIVPAVRSRWKQSSAKPKPT